jgi:hypothetical protein
VTLRALLLPTTYAAWDSHHLHWLPAARSAALLVAEHAVGSFYPWVLKLQGAAMFSTHCLLHHVCVCFAAYRAVSASEAGHKEPSR